MKFSKIRVSGVEIKSNPYDSTDRFEISKTILIEQRTRDGELAKIEISVEEDQIYEYHFDDETVWIGDPDSIEEVFPSVRVQKRSLSDNGTLVLPVDLEIGQMDNRSGFVKKIALKVLKIFVRKKVAEIVDSRVRELAEKFETRALNTKKGLLKLDAGFTLSEAPFPTTGSTLLFIHGTASSTKGSFEDLAKGENNRPSAVWESIQKLYGERIFAFEHQSLTKSPLENVLKLLKALPKEEVTLHLITQSRGGLIGDLLCRFVTAHQKETAPFNETEREYLEKHGLVKDLALIDEIGNQLKSRKIKIEKFIRVACPAAGTTLASKRLDAWLNVIFNVAGYSAGAVVRPVVDAFKELLLAAVETKDDPDVLPGLAPQNPESPVCKVINNPDSAIEIDIPYIIISGDNEFTFKWRGLLNILTNLFFLAKNDFVVNTSSMYKGPKRISGKTVYFLDEGGSVTHFNYFANSTTRAAILNGLTSIGSTVTGFAALPESMTQGDELRGIKIKFSKGALEPVEVSGDKPIVVLLPGIMGSNLSYKGEQLWVDLGKFKKGELTDLAYNTLNNRLIRAGSVVADAYANLYHYLSADYDVLVFPFDWRQDMRYNAGLLDKKLQELLIHNQPIKLVGHSMGGVLIRDFMAFYPETTGKLNSLPGFRILFLGSPLQGSFRIASVLCGRDKTIRHLAFIDFINTKKELLEVFVRFPGILALLPNNTDSQNDFAQISTWRKMSHADGDPLWPVPDEDSLAAFAAYREEIAKAELRLDYSKANYIAGFAGKGKGTVSGYEIVRRSFLSRKEKLNFLETEKGDGSVTWDSGIPSQIAENDAVYYSNVTHGELANDKSLFPAIAELLKTGRTGHLLRREPSVLRRDTAGGFGLMERSLVTEELDNTEDGIFSSLLGLYSTREDAAASQLPIQVLVTHGDLKYAKYPILIGHFEHDGIWSAEAAADRHLDYELSKRKSLGLYPGPLGTSFRVFPKEDSFFPGVLIFGLGMQGEMNERVLQAAVEQTVKRFLVSNMQARNAKPPKNGESGQEVRLSSLLVGTGYGGLTPERAMTAILTGIQNANAEIKNSYPENYKRVSEVEFIELFQDHALAASRTLREMEKQEENRTLFVRVDRRIRETMGRLQRINFGVSSSWWTRVTVRRYNEHDNVSTYKKRGLLFSVSTDAARVEEQGLFTAGGEILNMLKEASEQHQWSPELAKTLFEFLIPNDFKPLIKRQGNIIWQLDEYTASFPWELLQDNLENGKPLSVTTGMVRQLSSQNFRRQVRMATGNNVLVIADPDLKMAFSQLPHALAEGGDVARLLTDANFSVTADMKGDSNSIFKKLCVRPYKILHLAGHGVFEYGEFKSTGMLIGPESFLTPAHINQMSDTPELVFVNCCYLGKAESESEKFYQNGYRLAANIGTQLINNGVRAVVVAGWAVSDEGALYFANRFYEAMLSGEFFGAAVLKARKLVYERFGRYDNTWGAYQCYGDPSYKLENRGAYSANTDDPEFETDDVLMMELNNLLSELDLGHDMENVTGRLSVIEKVLSPAQRQNGSIVELLARLHASLSNLKEAIDYYESLSNLSNARYSVRALEQCCNLKVKRSVQRWRVEPSAFPEVADEIGQMVARLNRYLEIGETAERFNILAGCYKRLGMVEAGESKKIELYGQASVYYDKAYKLISLENRYYPLSNSAVLKYVLKKHGVEDGDSHKGTIKALRKEYGALTNRSLGSDDYWAQVARAELPLVLLIIDGFDSRKMNQEEETKLPETIKSLKKYSGHSGNWTAIQEQLDFLEDLVLLLPDPDAAVRAGDLTKDQKLSLVRRVRKLAGVGFQE